LGDGEAESIVDVLGDGGSRLLSVGGDVPVVVVAWEIEVTINTDGYQSADTSRSL